MDRATETNHTDRVVQGLLRMLRTHLGLDVGFIGEFCDQQRVFRYVDSDVDACPIRVDDADQLEDTYCHYVATGQLPEFLRDPREHPVAARMPATEALPVGTHVSVPIVLSGGSVYGTLCCFSFGVHEDMDDTLLPTVRLVADMLATFVEEAERTRRDRARRRAELRATCTDGGLEIVVQPIVSLATHSWVGAEALARFPQREDPPEQLFNTAWQLGVGLELELAATRRALAQLPALPEGVYLSVNASPLTLTSPDFLEAIHAAPPGRLVVEVTEHAAVEDYEHLRKAVRTFGDEVRLAIDDVGTGVSGLHQILQLEPDILKIDRALVSGVDHAPANQAMIAAVMTYASRMGLAVIAEGIETAEELRVLGVLGVEFGQGTHLGRPRTLRPVGAQRAETVGAHRAVMGSSLRR